MAIQIFQLDCNNERYGYIGNFHKFTLNSLKIV
jgi:hypothetical protein